MKSVSKDLLSFVGLIRCPLVNFLFFKVFNNFFNLVYKTKLALKIFVFKKTLTHMKNAAAPSLAMQTV